MKNSKYFLISILFLFYQSCKNSNTCNDLLNGEFNSTCMGAGAFIQGSASYNQCVNNWRSTHGSPDIYSTGGSNPNYFAHMWATSGSSEGIVANHTFLNGNTYTLSIKVRVSSNSSVSIANGILNVYAINGAPSQSGSNYNTPNLPSSNQLILSRSTSNLQGPNWQTISTTFTATGGANGGYNQLWIYPYLQNSSVPILSLEIDDVEILNDVATCDFQMEYLNGTQAVDFCDHHPYFDGDVYLNGSSSQNVSSYYIEISERPLNVPGAPFTNVTILGSNGWSSGSLGRVNLSNHFTFNKLFEYEIKLATQKLPCNPWVSCTQRISICNK